MTIALDTEIVATRFDPKSRTCFYTIERGGKRWTATVPIDHLQAHKGNKQARRNHLAKVLEQAMAGQPDPPQGTPADPHRPSTWDEFDKVPHGENFLNPADHIVHPKP